VIDRIEDQGQPVDPSVTGWAYTKHDDVTPLPQYAAEPPEHITHLDIFLPFLEAEWKTDATRTNEPVAETIFYPHPHTGIIHTLTIHESGAIDEGTASADGEAIQIYAERADDAATMRIEQRVEHTHIADTTHRAATD